jgi:hypothetical protein
MEEVAIDICLISKTVGRSTDPRIDHHYGCDRAEKCTTFTLKPKEIAARSSCDRPKRRPFGVVMSVAVQRKVVFYVDTAAAVGSNTDTIVPLCRALSIFNCAPCACAMCLTIARPSPVPPNSRERALSTR